MSLDFRIGRLDDVPSMADLLVHAGEKHGKAVRECERALLQPNALSLTVHKSDGESRRMVAFENAIFLRPGTVKGREHGSGITELLHRDVERLSPTEAELGRLNAQGGVDLLVVHYVVSSELPEAEQTRVKALMGSTFVDRFAGNRVRAILHVVRGTEAAHLAALGGYGIVDPHQADDDRESDATRPILIRGELEQALVRHNFPVVRFLSYQPPILRFPPAAREILRLAHLGYSDQHILSELGLSQSSLNSRWTRILDLAERKMPQLFDRQSGGRSRDRQPLLAYLENHLEELWPYEPGRVDQRSSDVMIRG